MIKQTVPASLDCQENVDVTNLEILASYGQGLHGDHIWPYLVEGVNIVR